MSNCSQATLNSIYRLVSMSGILEEAIVPPLGTLLMQFAPLIHAYFKQTDIWFLHTNVHQMEIPVKINKFLSKIFVIIFEDWMEQDSYYSDILKTPELSLFDVPHILTPSRFASGQ